MLLCEKQHEGSRPVYPAGGSMPSMPTFLRVVSHPAHRVDGLFLLGGRCRGRLWQGERRTVQPSGQVNAIQATETLRTWRGGRGICPYIELREVLNRERG